MNMSTDTTVRSVSVLAPSPSYASNLTATSSTRNGPPNYHRLEKLGKGSFATVYRAVHVETSEEAAIKDISQERLTLKLQENLESEISILKNHAHRNIVSLYDIERSDRHIYIILEYCRGGDLQRFIKHQPGARLGEATAQHFLRHLAAGLKFLNDRNLVHRDIKPQNLLLTENSPWAVLKIADFGFARHLEGSSMAETLCGSPLYMAPEILGQNQYNAKADLWSVGAVLFEMVAGRPPFAAQNQVELLKVIKRPLQIPGDVDLSRPCLALLQRLLKREPLERISFEDFFQNDFIDMKSSGILLDDHENHHVATLIRQDETTSTTRSNNSSSGSSRNTRAGGLPLGHGHGREKERIDHSRPPSVLAAQPSSFSPPSSTVAPSDVATPTRRMSMAESPFLGVATGTSSPSLEQPVAQRQRGHNVSRKMIDGDFEGLILAGTVATAATTAVSSRAPLARPIMLPFQTNGNSNSINPMAAPPTPRVNPFKPLTASPPGAVALSGHGRSTSVTASSMTRCSPSSSSSSSSSSASSSGGVGGGGLQGGIDGAESVESDGFVIVNAGVPHDVPSSTDQGQHRRNCHRPAVSPSFHHHYQQQRQQQQQQQEGSDNGGPLAGLHGTLYMQQPLGCVVQGQTQQQQPVVTIKSMDSLEGALRVLAYVENSTRHAILIASLGDAAAIAGLSLRRGGSTPGLGLLHSAMHTILLQENGLCQEGADDEEEGRSSITGTNTSSISSSSSESQVTAETRAVALLVDALVLYLKALSVVGTAIKALRQVIDVIQAYWSSPHTSNLRLAAWQHPGSLDGQLDGDASNCVTGSGSGSGAGVASSGSLQERISLLQGWLELHFSIILDRAQECRVHLNKRQQQHQKEAGSMEGSEWTASLGLVTRSAEELLYKHALSLAKEGAVKELLGQWGRGRELYAQARLMIEALLAEPLLPLEDQQTLEMYQAEFRARENELAERCRCMEEENEKVTATKIAVVAAINCPESGPM